MTKRPLAALLIAGTVLTLAACSENGGAKSIEGGISATSDLSGLRGFTGVEVSGPDDVRVTVGPAFKVTAQGDPKVLARIEVAVKDGILYIGRKKQVGIAWDSGDKGAIISVAMPALASASLTGSGDVTIDRATGKALDLSLTGSGDLSLGDARVDMLKASLTGSGGIKVAGVVREASLSATGSGDVDAGGLKAGSGDVNLLGSGDVRLQSDGAVKVHIMGSGNADIIGKAKCTVAAMGSGEARCRG